MTRQTAYGRRDAGRDAQATIEFTFAMVITVVLIVGMIKVFHWAGEDLAARRAAHESVLLDPTIMTDVQLRQARPVFYKSTKMNATVPSDIFGKN